jgi:hypothetical protein
MKLEDSTPIVLRTKQELSSATAKVGERVSFRVVRDVSIADLIIIRRGADAWGLVTSVEPKRRKGRPGNLNIAIESVQLLTGENAPLRAEQHSQGKSRAVATIADLPHDAIGTLGVAIPIDLFSMLVKGKDAYLPVGITFTAYLNGNVALDRSALERVQPAPVHSTGPATVTVFRPASAGTRFHPSVYCGKVALAKLPGTAYLEIQLPPGKYLFRSDDEQVVEVGLEEGQELFLQMQLVVKRGYKGHLARVDNEYGEREVAKLYQLGDKYVTKVSDANFAELKASPEIK